MVTLPIVLEAGREKHMEVGKETLQEAAERTWKDLSV